MDEDTLSHLFEPFFSTKPVGHGTGLGLALCRSTISAHKGGIYVTSKPGEGTRVEINLPVNPGVAASVAHD